MIQSTDQVTVSLPRTLMSGIATLSADLNDRLHLLLERNTDDALTPHEKAELETLVRMAEFGQLVTSALQTQARQPQAMP